jgi:hypothetical protein
VSEPEPLDTGWSDWLVSIALGGTMGFAVLAAGVVGIALAVLALGLIAWKGSRLMGFAGFACGFGALWAVIMWGAISRCNAENLQPGTTCEVGVTGAYFVAAIAVLVVGLAATLLLARRRRRR